MVPPDSLLWIKADSNGDRLTLTGVPPGKFKEVREALENCGEISHADLEKKLTGLETAAAVIRLSIREALAARKKR